MNVGITGHQKLEDPSAWPWVEKELSSTLDTLSAPVVAVTSLAVGADQLFARIVLRRGGSIHAVLPFANYGLKLNPHDVPAYEELLSRACVEILSGNGNDEEAYLSAGRRVVDLSQSIVAVWDGKPAKGKGGTADVVAYALHKQVPVIHINPSTRRVSEL